MKLYIAGPMSGLPDYNYPAFHEAANRLRAAGYEVLNPAENDRPLGSEWHLFMRDAIGMLIQCDGVAMLSGWSKSRGALLEKQIALSLEMPTWALKSWLQPGWSR